MDIKAYISSGILELYCTGALTEHENREVEALGRQYPEVKAEIESIQQALIEYANKYAQTPNPDLKQKIIDQLSDKTTLTTDVNTGSNKTVRLMSYALAAATLTAIFFFYQVNNTENTIHNLKTENLDLATENLQVVQQLNACHEQMSILMNKDTKVVPLGGLPIFPAARAIVYWDPATKNTYINVSNLPIPPDGKQYQLWALAGGKPIDAGVFDVNTGILQNMKQIVSAEAFAVTLENKGGSENPTMDQMYMMGKI